MVVVGGDGWEWFVVDEERGERSMADGAGWEWGGGKGVEWLMCPVGEGRGEEGKAGLDVADVVFAGLRDHGEVGAAAVELAWEVLGGLWEDEGAERDGEDEERGERLYEVVRGILEAGLDGSAMREAAARLLDLIDHDPGFGAAADRRAAIEEAAAIVGRDAQCQGFTEPVTVMYFEPGDMLAQIAYGGFSRGPSTRSYAGDAGIWLWWAADALQETVMDKTWKVWPVCPEHGTGLHLDQRSAHERGAEPAGAFWFCRVEGGHRVAAVGKLSRVVGVRGRRARREAREAGWEL
ncbi:hypothetical protein GCM10022221_05430 [Actinocorallia aurea]